MQPEARLTKKIIDALNEIEGCYCEKVHATVFGNSKIDVTGCIRGRAFKLEVKRPNLGKKSEPTDRQARTLKKWGDAGAIVGCAKSVEEAKQILRDGGMNV